MSDVHDQLGSDDDYRAWLREEANERSRMAREQVLEPEILNGSEVIPAPTASIIHADVGDVTAAFTEYKRVQDALDRVLPECTMNIRGKLFRKKNYWRAVATAFRLTVEKVDESMARGEPVEDNWGWLVTYRAKAPDGRHADGDGSCFASEKQAGQDTIHNVRAHAHTRAFNRAVSNLVGFGEVSAEEVQHEERSTRRTTGEPENHPSSGSGRRPAPEPSRPPAQAARPTEVGGAWLDEAIAFGKFKGKTWRHMSEGSIDGERHSYLKWVTEQPAKDDRQRITQNRATVLVQGYEAQRAAENAKMANIPDSPEWDAMGGVEGAEHES